MMNLRWMDTLGKSVKGDITSTVLFHIMFALMMKICGVVNEGLSVKPCMHCLPIRKYEFHIL